MFSPVRHTTSNVTFKMTIVAYNKPNEGELLLLGRLVLDINNLSTEWIIPPKRMSNMALNSH